MATVTKDTINARLSEIGLSTDQIKQLAPASRIEAWAQLRGEQAEALLLRGVVALEAMAAAETKLAAAVAPK